ncbi:hypothetical protein [Nocardioides litoris]|uniref:hypothetical protein n=1 Tax=Nocardioides litoris TaxID=1926648 RepID=UPI00112040CF|nr:hypothetical protein [Nocardioides litoris]
MAGPDHLFAELHRRHPDVDLVLLPPEPPRTDPDEAATDADLADARWRTASALRGLWTWLAPDSPVEAEVRWSYAADDGWVRPLARVVEKRPDGGSLLLRLADELDSDGWDVARPDGGLPRVVAVLDGLRLVGSWAEPSGALVLQVEGDPSFVGRDRAAALVRPAGRDGEEG